VELILDVATAAVDAGIGASTIRRWLANGTLTPVQTSPILVRTTDVRALRDENRARRRAPLDKRNRIEHP
jgi:predicted site-specific integrase-resolvase